MHHNYSTWQPSDQSRRQMLKSTACGFGHLALLGLLGNEARADPGSRVQPLALKKPHFAPRAKNVIFLFMHGGVSHIDTFDPKPELTRYSGTDFKGDIQYSFVNDASKKLLGSPFKFSSCVMAFSSHV